MTEEQMTLQELKEECADENGKAKEECTNEDGSIKEECCKSETKTEEKSSGCCG